MKNIENLEKITKGSKIFEDNRGKISNYELSEKINWVGMIISKKGSMRSNHYHKNLTQNCLLISGKYISLLKDLRVENSPIITQVINSGDLSTIPPMVVHVMIFLEDSVFINLVNGERNHENYGKGKEHTTPYRLITEEQKEDLLKNYKPDCRICGNDEMKIVFSLGLSPLANNLLETGSQKDELFPLEMCFCEKCYNSQLTYVCPPKKLFDNYLYLSSTGSSFRKHFEDAADKYIKEFDLGKDSLVVDIGGNDSVFLLPMSKKGVQVVNVEPATNIANMSQERGIHTINKYFTSDVVNKIIKEKGMADLVTANNVFAHTDNIKQLTLDVFELLKEDGTFIVECQYLLDTINHLTFDNIYHEHVSYFSVMSLNNFFNNLGLVLYCVEHIDTHGGSIRCYIKRDIKYVNKFNIDGFLSQEKKFGLDKVGTYYKFAEKIEQKKEKILKNIKNLKREGKRLVGFGSPAKSTTVLNYYGIGIGYIDTILEDNELKHNKFLPAMRIPIKSKKELNYVPDYVLVLAWNFFDEIKKNNQDLVEKGVQFITLNDLDTDKFLLPIPPKEIDDRINEEEDNFGDHSIF